MINASSLALLHAASISMRGVLVAVAVGRSKIGGQLILDPEEGTCERAGCFGFVINESEKDGDVVWAEWNGAFDEDEVGVCLVLDWKFTSDS
jgi:ribonuclease PH